MEKIIGVRVGEKYKTVEPFEIVMPDGTSSHVAHESDSTDLLNRGHVLEREDGVMQRMKEHARETSNSWDEKLRIANQYDG